jgi:type II secretion system protein I
VPGASGKRARVRKKYKAFTLVEVLITLTILTVALLAIFRGNVVNLRSAKQVSDMTVAVMAAESLMKDALHEGFPQSGTTDGTFEEEYFRGIKWKKVVESLDLPFVTDLKIVTVEVEWGNGETYALETVVSRY